MPRRPLIPAVVVLLTLALVRLPVSADRKELVEDRVPPPSLAVGTPFPMLELPTLDGEPRSIADFRGKKVVLHVFASW